MSEVDVTVFQALVAKALPAAFGGAVPSLVAELADPSRYGSMNKESSISFTFALGADERPRVLLTAGDDGGRARDLVTARAPAVAEVVANWSPGEVQYLLGAEGAVGLILAGVAQKGGDRIPADARLEAVRVDLRSGREELLTLHEAPPMARLRGAITAQVEPLLARGAVGMWFCSWEGEQAVSLLWVTEKPRNMEALELARSFATGPRVRATLDALESEGHFVRPIAVEWRADGSIEVSLWGIADGQRAQLDVPDLFFPGGVGSAGSSLVDGVIELPTAEMFASAIAATVESTDKAEVMSLVEERLYPGLLETVPPGGDAVEHARAVWGWLYDRLAMQPPPDRAVSVRIASNQLWVAGHEALAFQLGLARYLHQHPDVGAPSVSVLPAAIAALSDEELAARAEALLPIARSAEATFAAQPNLVDHLIPNVGNNAVAVVDTLERAVSGSFVAAAGRLHEWLMEYGPGGYDDDPAAMGLDDIDLDAGMSHAAIEEALADDDD
jgi:hypothetical protein